MGIRLTATSWLKETWRDSERLLDCSECRLGDRATYQTHTVRGIEKISMNR